MLRTEGRLRYARLTRRGQMAMASLLVAAGAWITYSSVTYVFHDKVLAAKDNLIADARLAYRSLLGEVAEYQKKFQAITRDLEENHGLMLGLVERNAVLQQNMYGLDAQLKAMRGDREEIARARDQLKGQLAVLEDQMRSASNRNLSLQHNLSSLETDLQKALSERNQALFESNRMRRQIRDLEGRLVELQENEEEAVQRLSSRAQVSIDALEKVIEIAGIEANRLVAADRRSSKGQGGPFIEAKAADLMPARQLKEGLDSLDGQLARWEALQEAMKKLPLAAPLEAYVVNSQFGKRRDPINKKLAMHYGVDLGTAMNAAIYAPAPGVVTYVGANSRHGRLVEVDHGAGLLTRYGHLNKALVKVGQELKFRDKIGLVGNTGRTTGTHLHYEILFRGKAKNPMGFIRAGQYVFQE
jgi:murein DD-endopeptidase MepM/ murein hydrolase activator NlpD